MKTFVRNIIGIFYSVAYGSSIFGIIILGYQAIFHNLPALISLTTAIVVAALASFYVAMIGYTEFNFPAMLGGVIAGALAWYSFSSFPLPYNILVTLSASSIVASIGASVFPKAKPRLSYINILNIIQVLEFTFTIMAAVLSIWVAWFIPLLIVIIITGFVMWRPFLIGACPLTLYQIMLRKRMKSATADEMEKHGFNAFFLNKFFRTRLFSNKAFMNVVYCGIALILLIWVLKPY